MSDNIPDYLRNVVEDIDNHFGDGYARLHPGLVGACVIVSQLEKITDALCDIEVALNFLSGDVAILAGTDTPPSL